MRRLLAAHPWRSLRLQLTLWYVALLAVILLAFSGILLVRLDTTLRDGLDDTLRSRCDLLVSAVVENGGMPSLAAIRQPLDQTQGEQFIRLYDASGRLVSETTTVSAPALPGDVTAALTGVPSLRSVAAGAAHLRVITVPLHAPAVGALQVGVSEDDLHQTTGALLAIIATLIPIMLLFAVVGGLFLAHRALTPVDRITQAAQVIEATDLHQRVPEPGSHDEISRLARTLNALIARLEAAFTRQRQFTADASHELRTPLTILQGELDVTLRRTRTIAEYQATLTELSEEVTRLHRIVADLLLLARADAPAPLPALPVDLAEVAGRVVAQLTLLAEAKERHLTLITAPTLVQGIAGDLERLLRNLVENAIRYTPGRGAITVTVWHEGAIARMSVHDTGAGIAPGSIPHLFERFYRADIGRNRTAGGTGLGLAIAQAIAHRHGGTLSVTSDLGVGSTFTLTLARCLSPDG